VTFGASDGAAVDGATLEELDDATAAGAVAELAGPQPANAMAAAATTVRVSGTRPREIERMLVTVLTGSAQALRRSTAWPHHVGDRQIGPRPQ
jgi:hypothetical protein